MNHEKGSATLSIIIIVLILLLGGLYFYRTAQLRAREGELNQERAAAQQNTTVVMNANAVDALSVP